MIRNRHGHVVELGTIGAVEEYDTSYHIRKPDGQTLGLSKDECRDFVPKVGDWILTTLANNNLAGVIIEGRVIRDKSDIQVKEDFEQFKRDLRLKRLERYLGGGEKLKEEVNGLHTVLRNRMNRFAEQGGIHFWIEDAPYEMYAMKGAQAILDAVVEEHKKSEDFEPVEWVRWVFEQPWEDQLTLIPNFGDGHSGNTALAAEMFAIAILEGRTDL